MTSDQWLSQAKLALKNSTTAALDCQILLADHLGVDKSWLLAHPEEVLQGDSLLRLDAKLARRMAGEPMAYIRGFSEFYGRRFAVNKDVLVPRPESEMMIELLVNGEWRMANGSQITVVDVGTGTGALGITAVLELRKLSAIHHSPFAINPILIDTDKSCLNVAKQNAKTHKVNAEFLQGNLLEPYISLSPSPFSPIVLANLPYVPDNYEINNAAQHEPKLALFGGADGLDLYRTLFEQLKPYAIHHSLFTIYTEGLLFQHESLRAIAEQAGFVQTAEKDLIQVFKHGK